MMTRKDFVVQYVLVASATRSRARSAISTSALILEADTVYTELGKDPYFQIKEN